MKNVVVSVFVALCLISVPAFAASKTKKKATNSSSLAACKKTLSVSGGGLFIYKNSAPLRSGGVGTPLIGYRDEPTLIMNRNVSSRGTATIYDSKGTSIGSCPWASAHGHAGGRFRCTMNTGGLRRTAVKNTNKPNIFFKINPSTCVEVPDAGRCYGSVKGKCNQLIK